MTQHIVALDVGGANIKLVDNQGMTQARAFPLWQKPEMLSNVLREMLQYVQEDAEIVATMTGELADCYDTKRQGVEHIVSTLESVAAERWLRIYLTTGDLVSPTQAKQAYALAAASNWHALASFVALASDWQDAVLIDIGSTTCDVIPIVAGCVVAQGRTDTQRLLAGELVYVGAERTPLAMVAHALPYRGQICPLARELFATTLDVQLVLKLVADQEENDSTADGRPATREFAIARIGRCVCADDDEWTEQDAEVAARYLQTQIVELLALALRQVYDRHPALQQAPLVIAGHGDWLVTSLLATRFPHVRAEYLRDKIGCQASRAAPAHALLHLAERSR